MRSRLFAIVLLLVPLAHLFVSPLGLLAAQWPHSEMTLDLRSGGVLKESGPFAPEEKVRVKPFSVPLRQIEPAVQLRCPVLAVNRFPVTWKPAELSGFQVRVCERPPPVCA